MRSVLCDEECLRLLERISNLEGLRTGLVIGQFTGKKDYVIHLSRTPDDNNPTSIEGKSFLKFEDISEKLISDHTRAVIPMLPGGMWVLGFYIVGPTDVFGGKDELRKIKSVASAVHNSTKGNEYLCGIDSSNQELIFHFNSLSKKFVCKALDMYNSSSLRPADWKFKSNPTSWFKLESSLNLNLIPSCSISSRVQSSQKKLKEYLKHFKKYIDDILPVLNGDIIKEDTELITFKNSQIKRNSSAEEGIDDCSFRIRFFHTKDPPEEAEIEIKELPEDNCTFSLTGVLRGVAFLNDKSTTEDAYKAIKNDLVRSLAARLQMHWETFDEPEDFNGEFLVRNPPRRVEFTPGNCKISFYEYMFEDEMEEEALASFQEALGFLQGNIVALEGIWEIPANLEEVCADFSQSELDQKSSNKIPFQYAKNEVSSNSFLLVGLIAAGITLLLSLLIHFLYS